MATQKLAKPPDSLSLEDRTHRGDNWKQFKREWTYYETAAKINKEGAVRVTHFLNVIGKEGQDMFETFSLSETNSNNITKVLQEFETRCSPATNVIYERYIFNKRTQQPGELLDHYITDIMKQAELCKYGTLKDELIRDRLVSGIQADKIRERLLSKKDITLAKTIELLKASEATRHQALDMATAEIEPTSTVQMIKTNQQAKQNKGMSGQHTRVRSGKPHKSCRYCGRQHEFTREACLAFDKTCFNCNKRGHFSKKMSSQCTTIQMQYLWVK